MVTKNYRNASRIIRAAITESFEDMMTDFISLLCIFVCRRLFLGHFASDTRTSLARTVDQVRDRFTWPQLEELHNQSDPGTGKILKPLMLPVNLVILSVRAYASQRPIQLIPSIKTLGGGDSIIGTCDKNEGSLQVVAGK